VFTALSNIARVLIGRETALAAVDRALDDVVGGQSRVLAIEGEPGIGKSVLLEAVTRGAAERNASVFLGRGDEMGGLRPFGPLLDAFAGDRLRPKLDVLVGTARGDRGAAHRAAPLEAASEVQSLVVDRIADAVEARCLEGPVVLGIDDLQWVDGASLVTLLAVLRQCADLPFGLVFTCRPVPRSRELSTFLGALGAGDHRTRARTQRVALEPLARADVIRLAETTLGSEPSPSLVAVLDQCGGNPFLVTETLTGLRDDGALATRPDGSTTVVGHDLPVSVRDAVGARMAGMVGEIREVAELAALLGSRFTLADLAAVTARPATELYPLVDELVRASLLSDDGTALSFRHDLVREAVAARVSPSIRAELHREIAQRLRDAGAPVASVAEHMILAAPSSAPGTLDVLREAAIEISPHDPVAGARLWRRAVELCPPTDPARDELLAGLVDALIWSGAPSEAQTVAAEVLTRPVAPAVEERLHSALGRALLLLGRPQEAVGHEERVIVLRETECAPTSWALAECAICRLFGLDLDGALRDAQAAVDNGMRENDAMAQILGLCVEAFARNTVGDTARAVALGTRAVQLADATPGGEGHRLHPNLFRGVALQTFGDHAAAGASFRLGRAQGEALGASWALPIYHFVTALAHWDAGYWDDLLAEVDAGIAFGAETGSTIAQVWAFAVTARVHLHRGNLAACVAALDQGDALLAGGGVQYGIDWLVLARALLSEANGQPREAFDLLSLAWETAVGLQATAAITTFGPDLARLSVALGEEVCAQGVARRLEDAVAAQPDDAVLRGRALRSSGIVRADATLLSRAAEEFDALGHPFEAATVWAEAGERLLADGDTASGSRAVEKALAVFDQLNALRDAHAVRERFAVVAPARQHLRRAPRRRSVQGWDALTPSEEIVVEEVCAGRSNTEIAERLGLSRRTVEAHLRSVYTKIGVPTRLALAAAHRGRPVD
jgi:DNA-binding CsgD family transcriptional regulator